MRQSIDCVFAYVIVRMTAMNRYKLAPQSRAAAASAHPSDGPLLVSWDHGEATPDALNEKDLQVRALVLFHTWAPHR